MISKKGIYYSLDAILAGIFLIGAIYLMTSIPLQESNFQQRAYLSQDLLNSLSELKLSEINSIEIQQSILNGTLQANKSVIEQAGEYWATYDIDSARELINYSFNENLLQDKLVNITIGTDQIFSSGQVLRDDSDSGVSKRMIAGISKGLPITGTSASAYLKKIRSKKTNAYAYFGGFIGQGNVSVNLYLAADFDSSRHIASELKAQIPGSFKLYINSIQCGGTYTGNNDLSIWNIADCNSSLKNGQNQLKLEFLSDLNLSYISGGYIKVIYTTDTLKETNIINQTRYEFPEIEGLINIYDSLAAQGIINSWTLNLSFYNEYDTFLTLGNETIFYATGSNQTQNIIVNSPSLLIPPTQIPLRLAVSNLSNVTVITEGVPSDSILVTDVSGSMGDCGQYISINNTYCGYEYRFWGFWIYRECIYPGSCISNECGGSTTTRNHVIFNETSTTCNATLLDIAKEADHLFVNTILSQSLQHKIGLSAFSTSANDIYNLSSISSALNTEINTYNDGGGTCTCCGVNRARTMINTSSNKKFIIVLSDGAPSYYCNSFTDFNGSGTRGDSSGSSSSAADVEWAINSSRYACNQNISVFTIGFGSALSAAEHDVLRQMACNDSLYFNSSNTDDLLNIYENISQQILLLANFSSQTLNVEGNYSPSKIFNNSYIDIHFTPYLSESYQGMISLNFESNLADSCNSSVYIPEDVIIWNAFVTSFSDMHWTKKLIVNGEIVYNIDDYGQEYITLGDPFQIQVPATHLITGAYNNISLEIGDSPTNTSNCSRNNSLIYSALINSSTRRTDSLEYAEGCNWTIESRNGAINHVKIPETYSGNNSCKYTPSNVSYNENDAYDSAMYKLLNQLDPEKQGSIIVDLQASDLEITLTTIGSIPYLWGPSIATVEVKS